jgi:hypothetical protein
MSRYAADTQVSLEKSQAEISQILKRYGAEGFGFFADQNSAIIAFRASGRQVRFTLPLPHIDSPEVRTLKGRYSGRTNAEAAVYREKLLRQKWRCLALAIKAKLEAVESGITTFEEEFLAHICLPGGSTVGAWLKPQLEQAYSTGKMPPLLLEDRT